MRCVTSIGVGLLLVACAGCAVPVPIDGATTSSTTSGGQSGSGGTSDTGSATVTGEVTGTTGDDTTEPTTGAAACVPPSGTPGEVLVTVPVTGMGHQHVRAVAVDDNGDTYIAGSFSDTLALQGEEVDDGFGPRSAFVARLDCAGELVWLNAARSGDVDSFSRGHAIAVHDGRVYLGGEITGAVEFTDGDPLMGGSGKAFIAGFDVADGALAEVFQLGEDTAAIRGLAIDGEKGMYAVGGCDGGGAQGVLVARWLSQDEPDDYTCTYTPGPGVAETRINSVAVTAGGGLVLGGQMSSALMGWPDPGVPVDGSRGFIAGLAEPFALPSWLVTLGDGAFDGNRVDAVVVRDGEVFAAARGARASRLEGPSDTACGDECEVTTTIGVHNTALLHLDGEGNCLGSGVVCSDGAAAEEIWGLAPSADGIYVTGQFSGSLLLNGEALAPEPHPVGVRTFVMRLGADLSPGTDGWVLLSDDANETECGVDDDTTTGMQDPRSIVRGAAVAVGPDGLVVAGSVCGPGLSLGGMSLKPEPQSHDGFVAKLGR